MVLGLSGGILMLKIGLLFVLILGFQPAFAVDGYRDIKFGIDYKQLKKLNKCSLAIDPTQTTKQVKVYSCSDFKFGDQVVSALFYLIDGKLLRIALMIGDSSEDFLAYLDALSKKFGAASRRPASAELAAFDQGKSDLVDVAWDNNTVLLRQYREDSSQATFLIYTSPQYESALLKSKTKGTTDAL